MEENPQPRLHCGCSLGKYCAGQWLTAGGVRRKGHPLAPAFSLVELVIVVVIIGVIAAIAVPRISRGSSGAGVAALRASLHALRTGIDMYAAEHGGIWPGADGDKDTLADQLAMNTDSGGNIGTTSDVHIYGPYLRNGFPPISVGPNVGAQKVHMTTDNPPQVDESKKKHGWMYNYETGKIIANTDDLDDSGVAYNTY